MSTIAKLVAQIDGDNSGLASTLADSASRVKKFYGDAVGKFDLGVNVAELQAQGTKIADSVTRGLSRRFEETSLSLKEQLFSGLIDEGEFKKEGAIAAQAFNNGLTEKMHDLAEQGMLTPEAEAKLVDQYKVAGLAVGRAFADAARQEMAAAQMQALQMNQAFDRAVQTSQLFQAAARSRAASNIRSALGAGAQEASVLGGLLDGVGLRANRAGISILFAFESFERGGAAGERGIVRALRAVATLAAAFGPEGWLVAAAAAGVAAVIDHMDRLTKAIDKVHQKFEEKFKELANSFNNEGMIGEVRKLDLGDAANGMGLGGAYLGSINDLKARIPMEQGQLLEAIRRGDQGLMSKLQEDLRTHNAQLKELSDERAKYVAQILDPNQELPGYNKPKMGLAPMKITANAPSKDRAEEKKQLEELAAYATRLEETWSAVNKEHSNSTGLLDRMLSLHGQIETKLNSMKDKTSEFAVTLRRALSELDKNPFIAYITGANPNLPQAFPGLLTGGGTGAMGNSGGGAHAFFSVADTSVDPVTQLLRKIAENGGMTVELLRTGKAGSVFTTPNVGSAGKLNTLLGPTIGNAVAGVKDELLATLSGTLTAAFGPVALLMRALQPALKVIGPLLDDLVAPLAAVAEVVAVALKPAMQLFFPIIRALAVAFAFLDSIVMRITAGIATAFGKAIEAIGKVIAHIPFLGSVGKAIENAGASILKFAEGQYQAADQMDRVRQKLESMQFGTTADAITGLGDAASAAASVLNDVPQGYKIALDRFLATDPRTLQPGAAAGAAGSASSGGVVVQGDVYVDARAKSPKEMFDAVREQARTQARSQFGDTQRAPDTLK